jgi:hypothetical protein
MSSFASSKGFVACEKIEKIEKGDLLSGLVPDPIAPKDKGALLAPLAPDAPKGIGVPPVEAAKEDVNMVDTSLALTLAASAPLDDMPSFGSSKGGFVA